VRAPLPALFVSHGSPTLVLDGGPAYDFLRELPSRLPAPEAILCVSAHWERRRPGVTAVAIPPTIHDFGGFPDEMYRIRYACQGSPALAGRVRDLLVEAGIEADLDEVRGLDHGAWVPLTLMYPEASIPVVQLSVQPLEGPAHHLKLGRAMAALREEGVLILGSGGATHNLRDFGRHERDSAPAAYAVEFDDWLAGAVGGADRASLLSYSRKAPHASRNHPTPEHFLPLFVALGAGGEGASGERLHASFTYGVFSMASFAWGMEHPRR